jgi:hypothetical protein
MVIMPTLLRHGELKAFAAVRQRHSSKILDAVNRTRNKLSREKIQIGKIKTTSCPVQIVEEKIVIFGRFEPSSLV